MPDAPTRVTFRDIAREAGVSPATVSLALRNSSQISLPVRERIREVTKRMGYMPNPLLSAYQASVRAAKPVKFQAALGWINDSPEENIWTKPWMKPLIDGARARAAELGYQLDEIWVPETKPGNPAENFRRWERILKARGIYGVILPTMVQTLHTELPWEGFCIVCVGKHHSLTEVSRVPIAASYLHHRVSADYFFNMHLALVRLRESGYRRIGLALSTFMDRETDLACSAMFSRTCLDWPKKQHVPILFSDSVGEVRNWAAKHRPDAVICSHPDVRLGVEAAGLRVPADVRVAHLNIAPDVADWTGIDRRPAFLGHSAVDIVSSHLMRNERGVPRFAKEVSIEGVWVEGKT